ncbi:bifunctional riboflavin kinase/FMN adenylyltransferase [Bacillus pseudomycoides]|uniref:Riboflavin biosynthesis protein n=1 Tax=Bacillus pseudomycoides TaxID=64104 RepID=A0AA91VFN6_9BACI|nr:MULTISPECIES: bifunctional riboflavin kinase/FAD synthetase [Bacillus]PEB55115.1 bifunctional riboflavin kinase/FMN adenylyltransferase [Bacillus sp. AFS098217]PED84171.1 bifunctional riboflavin kinase/FMN adenylyltransferase [Bacillus pseudomycoides]PEU15697.1 bifunctional riboflavin kinase/FMN adenylyltransferase [Bacillus sp. AFS019443]PEU21201.1 bifunctional riboflavin kinase/FMN adenylyltransferase [Bacillus sp. AFS014408]PFW65002.1 bifunctional riboflavin kinase/FMN adenylyltransferas
MKLIHLTHPHEQNKLELPPTVMALGFFDGIHLGHQRVIRTAKKIADERGYKSAVITFHPHPSVILGKKEAHVEYITPMSIKEKVIASLGIDMLYVVKFDEVFAGLLPQQFVDEYIIGLNVKHVVAGFDYSYGRLGKGTMETLPFHARGEFTQTVIEKVEFQEEKVSSTALRKLIRDGEMEQIPSILGRAYTVEGTVVHGDKRGRQIGFPTANVALSDEYLLPPVGVYAVRLKVHDEWHDGVCNIGYKPTFKEAERKLSIEVHLFDFNEDIYDQIVTVEWHMRIREEKKFNGIDELVAQIAQDKMTAQEYFSTAKNMLAFSNEK